jgi:hypothetical protein
MGFTYPPIVGDSTLYNPRFYPSIGADGVLTFDFAQTLYLSKNDFRLSYLSGVIPGSATSGSALVLDETLSLSGLGSVSCTALTVGGVAVGTLPAFLDGITPGTAANNKALVLGSAGEVGTISSLTATNIYGSIKTGAQPNIILIGTQNSAIATTFANDTGSLLTYGIWTNSAPTPLSCRIQMSNLGMSFLGITNRPMRLGTNSLNFIFLQPSGHVSIGSNVDTHKLYVDGTLRATDITGTLTTGAQPSIPSVGTLTNLTLSTGGTGLQTPNLKFWNSTTALFDNFNQSNYLSVVEGGCVTSKALVVDSNKDIGSIRNLSCTGTFTASTSISTPSLTTDTITNAGTQTMSATTLNINPTTLQIKGTTLSATATELNALSGLTASSKELNYSDITTLGSFQVSKELTLDASGRGLMPLGTADSNCIRFYGGTTNRETINIYRESDTNGLIIASRTTNASINKTYPILRLISTVNPETFSGTASTTTDDLFRIDWNNGGSGGFAFETHRLAFDIGNTRPYKSGYPHTFALATSANAFAINVNGSTLFQPVHVYTS